VFSVTWSVPGEKKAENPMFETAELGRAIPKGEYKARVPALRESLLEVQGALREASFPVIVLFAGVDGAGKGETVNMLNGWLDPRWMVTRAFGEPSQEERERPDYWRFWRDLPPKGHIGLMLSAWYSKPLIRRVYGELDDAAFDERLEEILAFEKTLTDDGAMIIKFWMHLGKKAQGRRLKSLEKDPLLKWRVTRKDWKHFRRYKSFVRAAERIIMRTSTGNAPWHIIEGSDHNYRSLSVGEKLLAAIRRGLERERRNRAFLAVPQHAADADEETITPAISPRPRSELTVLSRLDLSVQLDKDAYQEALATYQGRLNLLHRRARDKGVSTVVVFEGQDAAGKGGAIRRINDALDARSVQVIPIAAPTDEERAQHYLWRFWRHLSRAGRVTIFDRSWYGRVLVERVEGFAAEQEWRRAYAEINHFEQQLVEHGTVLVKYWVQIDRQEQLARFKAREETPYKRWKLTPEDWRNREKWEEYETAVHDMVERTSTLTARWHLIEGNDKRYARVKILRILCESLDNALSKDSRNE